MTLLVQDIMTPHVVTFDVSTPLRDLISTMIERGIGCAIILENNRLAGIVTERDLVRKVVLRKEVLSSIRVRDIMTPYPLYTVKSSDGAMAAAKMMTEKNIKYLPVLTEQGAFVGIITQTNIVQNVEQLYDFHFG